MRPAFTLVEVIAAAAIASVAGIALLQMNSQSTFLFSRLSETASAAEMLSVVGNHADIRYNRTTKSLEDLLGSSYVIENDDLRHYLKNTRIDYSERLVDTVGLDAEEGMASQESVTQDELANAAAVPTIQFELLQVGFKQKALHGAVLVIRQMP